MQLGTLDQLILLIERARERVDLVGQIAALGLESIQAQRQFDLLGHQPGLLAVDSLEIVGGLLCPVLSVNHLVAGHVQALGHGRVLLLGLSRFGLQVAEIGGECLHTVVKSGTGLREVGQLSPAGQPTVAGAGGAGPAHGDPPIGFEDLARFGHEPPTA